jgi:Nitroreductase family
MTEQAPQRRTPLPADQVDYLIATAARAPSVHNTQPWRFKATQDAIELYADQRRKLHVDPVGREMLISCGAALFGLRLAVRSLGYRPVIELFPDRARLRLLARVTLGAAAPMTPAERALLEALPHRHTHRGPFDPGPLPDGLIARLQHDTLAEGATLAVIRPGLAFQRLADIVDTAARRLDLEPIERAEVSRWSRPEGSSSRDGVPAQAFAANPAHPPGRLRQRDFDLGRGLGLLTGDGTPDAVTAVLLTSGDGRADWLRAGQALHRLLAHAAVSWVFASLYSEPLEAAEIRALIRRRLALPGAPQLLLQLGIAHTTLATARRPPADLIEP